MFTPFLNQDQASITPSFMPLGMTAHGLPRNQVVVITMPILKAVVTAITMMPRSLNQAVGTKTVISSLKTTPATTPL